MRDRSPVETLLSWASFGAASIAIHLLIVFGGRGDAAAPAEPLLPFPSSAERGQEPAPPSAPTRPATPAAPSTDPSGGRPS